MKLQFEPDLDYQRAAIDAVTLKGEGEAERLYFVEETKGSLFAEDLRILEGAKIACGRRHFEALAVKEGGVRYAVARTLDDVLS